MDIFCFWIPEQVRNDDTFVNDGALINVIPSEEVKNPWHKRFS